MNRNRFTTPPPPYNIDTKINPLNFQPPIPRFAIWPQSLPPLPPNPIIQQQYSLPQPKKNYCSTCDLWTVEPYNNHQTSPAHMAKKASLRTNQIYQPIYPNIINNVANNVINNAANPINTIKKKCKRITKRSLNNNKLPGDLSEQNEPNLIDGFNVIPQEQFENKTQLSNTDAAKRKGQEMLIPVSGVFCALCEMYFPDKEVAENEHCSSEEHCDAYEKLLLKVQDAKVEKRPLNSVSTEETDPVAVEPKRPKFTQEHQDRDFRLLQSRSISSPDVPASIVLTPQAEMLSMVPNYTVNNIGIGGVVVAPVCSLPSLVPVLREPAPPIPREPAPPIPPEPSSPVSEEPALPLVTATTTMVTTMNNSVPPVVMATNMNNNVPIVPPVVMATNMNNNVPIISPVVMATTMNNNVPVFTPVVMATNITTNAVAVVVDNPISTPSSAVTSNGSAVTSNGTVTNVSVNEGDRSTGSDCQAPDFSLEFPEDMEDYDEGEIISDVES